MKKRVRIYKPKDQMKQGGPVTSTTQDSKLGGVPEERINNFTSWLQNSAVTGAERQKKKEYEEYLKSMSNQENPYGIPGYNMGGSLSPGASLEKTTKDDTNLALWQQDYMRNQQHKTKMGNDFRNYAGYAGVIGNMPDIYKYEGEQVNPFGEGVDMTGMEITDYGPGKDKRHRTLSYEATGTPSTQPTSAMSESQSWDNSNMSDEDWENYMNDKEGINHPKLRNAAQRLKYAQYGGTPYYSPVETGEGLLNEDNFVKTKQKRNGRIKQKEITEKRFDRIQNRYDRRGGYAGEGNDTTVHRRGNKSVSDMNPDTTGPTKPNYYGDIYGGQGGYNNLTPPQVGNNYYPNPVTPPAGDNPYYTNPTQNLIAPSTPDVETPNMTPPSFVRDGGFINLPRAQNGLDCPIGYEKDAQGNCVPVTPPTFDELDVPTDMNKEVETNPFKSFDELDVPEPLNQLYSAAENPDLNSGMKAQGELELTKQNKLETFMDANPYVAPELAITAGNVIANIGENITGETAKQKADIRKRTGPQYWNKEAGPERGDYMANVPGFGEFLKPDKHTKWGQDTKVARDGGGMNALNRFIPKAQDGTVPIFKSAQDGGSMNVGDEQEMSDEELERLLAQGYQFEFID